MNRNDAIWIVVFCLSFMSISDLSAEKTLEEQSQEAYELLQGDAAGEGDTPSEGGVVEGKFGLKAPPEGLAAGTERQGPDGTDVPEAEKDEEEEETNYAKEGAKVGSVVGGVGGAIIGSFFGGVGAVPGWAVGAGVGATAGGLIGYFIGKVGQGIGNLAKTHQVP